GRDIAKDVAFSRPDAELLLGLCEAFMLDPETTSPCLRQVTSAVIDIIAHSLKGSAPNVIVPLNTYGASVAQTAFCAEACAIGNVDDATFGRIARALFCRMWRLGEPKE
ncbi:MAG TPA: hypothetical protein VMA37_13995, partial [Acetobacteraceae bacterium]|nr:hypothetical protein [Acetobacteraceae bacterium]